TRLPEFAAPNLRNRSSVVTVEADLRPGNEGVLYAVGGIAGGVSLYLDGGHLVYEYNALLLKRSVIRTIAPLPTGRCRIEVETMVASPHYAAPAQVVLRIDGQEVGRADVPHTVPLTFTATETFDVGEDLGSPVALEYFERAPFRFNGRIHGVHVAYKP